MTVLFAINGWHYLFSIPLSLICIFLTLLILVQRGRGGGLTGALGGMGGQSAFGTKAGDVFTRVTIVVAAVWIFLSMAAVKVLTQQASTGGLRPGQRAGAPLNAGKNGATGIEAPEGTKADEAEKAPAGEGSTPEAPASDEGASAPADNGSKTAPAAEAPAAEQPVDGKSDNATSDDAK
jgi:preprotein translocase subunit SecG